MFDTYNLIIGSFGVLSLGVAFGIVIGILFASWDHAEMVEKVKKQRNDALHAAAKLGMEVARLTGELSKAQNTLRLVTPINEKKDEPVRAKTAAEVRQAVERRNMEESE